MQPSPFFNRIFSSRRRMVFGVFALVIVMVGAVVVLSQALNRPQTCSTSIPVEQDIQESVAFQHAFESPQWTLDYANHESSVSARWYDQSGLGHLDYLRYNCGLTTADLDKYRFDISLGGYDRWQRLAQCELNGVRLHEFAVVYDGNQDYRVRFWLKPVNNTRLAAFQLSFPVERQQDMETYAARLFPELSACP